MKYRHCKSSQSNWYLKSGLCRFGRGGNHRIQRPHCHRCNSERSDISQYRLIAIVRRVRRILSTAFAAKDFRNSVNLKLEMRRGIMNSKSHLFELWAVGWDLYNLPDGDRWYSTYLILPTDLVPLGALLTGAVLRST